MSNGKETSAISTTLVEEIGHNPQFGEFQNIQPAYKMNVKTYLKWSQLIHTIPKGKGKINHLIGTAPKTRDPMFDA